jgi:hypothetical protein
MPNRYVDTEVLKKGLDAYLKQPLTDNDREDAFFDYPIDVLEA